MTIYIVIFLSLFLFNPPALAADFLVVEGKITDSTGLVPVEAANVNFVFDIYSPGAEQCLLYSETQSANMTGSKGFFSFKLGQGSRSGANFENTSVFTDILDNSVNSSGITTCVVGNSYNPAANASRKLRISYDDGSGLQTLQQDIEIGATAYALSAAKIDGLASTDLIQVNTITANVSQAGLETVFNSAADVTELRALIDGTSSLYNQGIPTATVDNGGQILTNVAAPVAASDVANKSYVDSNLGSSSVDSVTLGALAAGNAGEVLTWNGAQWTSGVAPGDSTKLPLDGSVAMTGPLDVSGFDISANNISATGSLSANALSTSAGGVAFYNGANYVGFVAGATPSNIMWTLPNTDGTTGQVLQTDGAGVLSWASPTVAVNSVGSTEIIDGSIAAIDIAPNSINEGQLVAGTGVAGQVLASDGVGNLLWQTPTIAASSVGSQEIIDSSITAIDIAPNTINERHLLGAPGAGTSGQILSSNGNSGFTWITPPNSGDFFANGTVPMTGNFDLGGFNIFNLASGTSAAPSLSFSTSTGTGIFSPAVNDLSFSTAGVSRLLINATGNIGIGSSTPATALDVAGTVKAISFSGDGAGLTGVLRPDGSVPMTGSLLASSGTGTAPGLAFAGDADTGIYSPQANDLGFVTWGTEQMRLTASGNLGVGVITPSVKLDVAGAVKLGYSAVACGISTEGALRWDTTGKLVEVCDGFGWKILAQKLPPMPTQPLGANPAQVDFQTNRTQEANITAACGTLPLWNMKDGGEYVLMLQVASASTCVFNAFSDGGVTALTVVIQASGGATYAGGENKMWRFTVVGNNVFATATTF